MNLKDLSKPFDPQKIHWRVGVITKDKKKGLPLAYIDARDVMQRLDEVCGPAGWQCRYPHAGAKTVCEIGIRIVHPGSLVEKNHTLTVESLGEWVWKANGAGDTDVEADKGALSDAFKRAAVLWGIGQYLYDVKAPWVTLDGKKIAKHEMTRLFKLVGGQSSGQLKENDEWAKFDACLLDANTVIRIENLYRELVKEGWPENWLRQAAEKCAAKKKELIDAMPDAEDQAERLEYNGV